MPKRSAPYKALGSSAGRRRAASPGSHEAEAAHRAAGATSLLLFQPPQSPFCGSSLPISFKHPTQQLVLFPRPRSALRSSMGWGAGSVHSPTHRHGQWLNRPQPSLPNHAAPQICIPWQPRELKTYSARPTGSPPQRARARAWPRRAQQACSWWQWKEFVFSLRPLNPVF